MKTLITALARRMVVKIFASVGLVVAAALILLARKQSADEVHSLTESLQFEANLRLRGTVSNPVLLGRINITEGDLTFFDLKEPDFD